MKRIFSIIIYYYGIGPQPWAHPRALLHSGGPLSREFRQFTIHLIFYRHLTPYN